METTMRNLWLTLLQRGRESITARGGSGYHFRHPQHQLSCLLHSARGPRHLNLGVIRRMRYGMAESPKTPYTKLTEPSVIYSDNHLLVVNKPPGWHSVPNPTKSDKCILSRLRDMQLGGGSRQDFLLPLHRIDQPCSGLLMFGKTSKAASRITKLWKKKQVQKFYLAAVPCSNIDALRKHSVPSAGHDDTKNSDMHETTKIDKKEWFTLRGRLESRNEGKQQRSVRVRPLTTNLEPKEGTRMLSMRWKFAEISLGPTNSDGNDNPHAMLIVETKDGAKHMVRALLAQVGKCHIQGDLRYGGNSTTLGVLPDQSVALHAYRIHLGPKLKLGSLSTYEFEAPFPSTWESFFGFSPQTGIH